MNAATQRSGTDVASLQNNFSEYMALQMWSLLLNGYNQNAYFSGNKNTGNNRDRIVAFPQQRYVLANAASKTKEPLDKVFSLQSRRST
jgi:hypothetical protein